MCHTNAERFLELESQISALTAKLEKAEAERDALKAENARLKEDAEHLGTASWMACAAEKEDKIRKLRAENYALHGKYNDLLNLPEGKWARLLDAAEAENAELREKLEEGMVEGAKIVVRALYPSRPEEFINANARLFVEGK